MKHSTSTEYLVISAVGRDRPGIVDEVSQFLFAHGCNIEDSKMAILGGDFAIILLASGQGKEIATVQKDIRELESQSGLSITVRPTEPPAPHIPDEFVTYELTATSLDHPGIVHRISHLLHQHGVNIESADTHVYNAPVTGAPVFHLEMRMEVPAKLSLSVLRDELQRLGDEDNVDIDIKAVVH